MDSRLRGQGGRLCKGFRRDAAPVLPELTKELGVGLEVASPLAVLGLAQMRSPRSLRSALPVAFALAVAALAACGDGGDIGVGDETATPDPTSTAAPVAAAEAASTAVPVAAAEAAPAEEPLTGLIAISSSRFATCALRSDGSPVCWGAGVAAAPPDGDGFVDIVVDEWGVVCALRRNGMVVCWGDETYGPVPQTEERFTAISENCGIRQDDGAVACFDGTLMRPSAHGIDEPFTSVSSRANVCALSESGLSTCSFGAPGERFIDVSAGRYLDCAIRADGSPVCTGDPIIMERIRLPEGELFIEISAGEGSPFACALREDGSPICWGEGQGYPSWTPEDERLRDLSAGWQHVCAIRIADGAPVCWGAEDPAKDVGQASPPGGPRLQSAFSPNERFTAISVGFTSACALRADGSPACAGKGLDAANTPPPNERFIAISVGALTSCGLLEDGSPLCWTSYMDGLEAIAPPEGERFTAISNGTYHACALRHDGSPSCWLTAKIEGDNFLAGDLPEGERFTAISSGGFHACGLREDGSAVCWAALWFEDADQDGMQELQRTIAPPEGERFTAISSGGFHVCGLREDGSAVCWGGGEQGQASPPEGERFAAISSGGFHACALRLDGSPVCWGAVVDPLVSRANQGQASPPEGERFAAISSGTFRSCGLREDGSAVCWGNG